MQDNNFIVEVPQKVKNIFNFCNSMAENSLPKGRI